MAVLTSDARSGILPPGTDDASGARLGFQGAATILRKFFGWQVTGAWRRRSAKPPPRGYDGWPGAPSEPSGAGVRPRRLGATFVGFDVAELLHGATTAIVGTIPLGTLWHVVLSYPTVSEVWLRLLEARR